jgi:hypothetical protein
MTKSPRPSKTSADLSESVHQRLNMYALAAGAAGVGMLALARPAEAKIVYTPANLKLFSVTPLDLNHDGIADFTLRTTYFITSVYHFQTLTAKPDGSNEIVGKGVYAAALPLGARVGMARRFSKSDNLMAQVRVMNTSKSDAHFRGQWADGGQGVKNHYLGLKFLINGKVHFGWARMKVSFIQYHEIQAVLTGYAYETIPNKAIITGKTKGSDEVQLQPTTLGHLAQGASALPAWRVKQVSSTTH